MQSPILLYIKIKQSFHDQSEQERKQNKNRHMNAQPSELHLT